MTYQLPAKGSPRSGKLVPNLYVTPAPEHQKTQKRIFSENSTTKEAQPTTSPQHIKIKEEPLVTEDTRNRDTDVINIKVDSKFSPGFTSYKKAKHLKTDQSFHDSDIADEFEYDYDPGYLQKLRFHSPQPRPTNIFQESPRGQKTAFSMESTQIADGLSDGDIIQKACKDISHMKAPPKFKKKFVNRMEFDGAMRISRQKAFENLQQTASSKDASVEKNNRASKQSDGSPCTSPNRDNLSLTKKLSKQESDNVANRLMQYDLRKKMAIKHLQNKKIKEEAQLLSGPAFKKKLKPRNQEMLYNRLAVDALRRRNEQRRQLEIKNFKEEEDLKKMFKPKINKPLPTRDHAFIYDDGPEQPDRMLQFESEAFARASNQNLMDTSPHDDGLVKFQSPTPEKKSALPKKAKGKGSKTGKNQAIK